MRLIVKQVQLNVTDPEKKVRVELMRNGKKISTDYKPKDENTGTFNIKQSFNQKFKERFDNESMRWIEDKVELSIYYGGEGEQNAEETLVGTCQFDITKYIDQGGKNEKAVMLQEGEEPQNKSLIVIKGNSEEHPDAHLIFRIFVDAI